MSFIEADAIAEDAMLDELLRTSPKAREAVEDFDRECDFRGKLVRAREAAGITQKELQERTNLDQRTISRIEVNKEISPSIKTLMKYLGGLGYELDVVKKTTV